MKKINAAVRKNAAILTKEEMKHVQGGNLAGCYIVCEDGSTANIRDCALVGGLLCTDGKPPRCYCD